MSPINCPSSLQNLPQYVPQSATLVESCHEFRDTFVGVLSGGKPFAGTTGHEPHEVLQRSQKFGTVHERLIFIVLKQVIPMQPADAFYQVSPSPNLVFRLEAPGKEIDVVRATQAGLEIRSRVARFQSRTHFRQLTVEFRTLRDSSDALTRDSERLLSYCPVPRYQSQPQVTDGLPRLGIAREVPGDLRWTRHQFAFASLRP